MKDILHPHKFGILLVYLLSAIFLSMVVVSNAQSEGGQIQQQKTIYDVHGSPVGTVIAVPEGCEIIVPQSGKAVYLMCEDDD